MNKTNNFKLLFLWYYLYLKKSNANWVKKPSIMRNITQPYAPHSLAMILRLPYSPTLLSPMQLFIDSYGSYLSVKNQMFCVKPKNSEAHLLPVRK